MGKNLPAVRSQAPWPSTARDQPRSAPRAGWPVRCPSCGHEGPTLRSGTCAGCYEEVLPDLPAVRPPPAEAFPQKSIFERDLLELLPPILAIPLRVTGRMFLIFMALAFFWPLGLVLLFSGVRDALAALAPPAPDGIRNHSPRLRLCRAWVDITRLRRRRGLVARFEVETHGLIHKRLDLAVRVRGPDGRYLPGMLRNYRGECGEVLVRHVTRPLKSQSSRFPDLWVFLPLRALPIPASATAIRVQVEGTFACEGKLLAEATRVCEFVPTADDLDPRALPRAAAAMATTEGTTGEELVLLEARHEEQLTTCGVCGDALAGEVVVRCELCDSASHQECWEYLQGCSTYACEGRPA